jgi:hypothetical protein
MMVISACEEERNCCVILKTDELQGTWLLFETGYSPGGGNIVEDIPAIPVQTIKFEDGTIVSTTQGMEEIRFYKILSDTVHNNSPYLAFYKDDPEIDSPLSTVSFELQNSILKLSSRWCIEGCHMGLKRLE